MTECNTKRISFSPARRRKVIADFDGGRLTTDAGVLLLREVDQRIGLIDAINDCLPDPRDPRYIAHEQREMLAQRIFSLALGYEDLNDQQTLRNDPALQAATGKDAEEESPLASPPTLCRLENRVTRKSLVEMSKLFIERFLDTYEEPPEEIILDFDATDDLIHGNQDKRFYHGYYRGYCFLPLYVFCGGHLLCSLLRPSNIDGAKYSRVVAKMLVQRIRQKWPDVRIILRGDGGFCRWRLMNWSDKNRVDYVFGLPGNKILQKENAPLMKEAEGAFQVTGEKQRLFGEIAYGAKSWGRKRRVIMKAERLLEGPNQRFVVTSLSKEEMKAQAIYDEGYAPRGDMENRIKEQQLMLFADRTSCQDFLANQFRLLLSSFAYVLMHELRESHLKETELEKAQVTRIRLVLLKIAARVTVSVRRVVFHLSSSCPYQNLFRQVAETLLSLKRAEPEEGSLPRVPMPLHLAPG